MNIRYTKLLLASLLGFYTPTALPVCPEMEVWSNGTNYRYLIKDFHADYAQGASTIQQHHDIVWAAENKKSEGSFVIVEDASSYSGHNQKVQNMYEKTAQTIEDSVQYAPQVFPELSQAIDAADNLITITPLLCLSRECAKRTITCYNAECNQAIESYSRSMFPAITQQEVTDELLSNIALASTCNHAQTCINNINQKIDALMKPLIQEDFIKRAQDIRINLLDAQAICKLSQWNTIKHGFICLGKAHMENVKKAMSSLGYRHIESIGNPEAWHMPFNTPELEKKHFIYTIKHALNLKTTFEMIFAKQKQVTSPNKPGITNKDRINTLLALGALGSTALLAYNKPYAAGTTAALVGALAWWWQPTFSIYWAAFIKKGLF